MRKITDEPINFTEHGITLSLSLSLLTVVSRGNFLSKTGQSRVVGSLRGRSPEVVHETSVSLVSASLLSLFLSFVFSFSPLNSFVFKLFLPHLISSTVCSETGRRRVYSRLVGYERVAKNSNPATPPPPSFFMRFKGSFDQSKIGRPIFQDFFALSHLVPLLSALK